MLQIKKEQQIHIAVTPIDFRRGINGLIALCQSTLACDPWCGHLFVFRNHKSTAIKILMYDGTGFWLAHKRLSSGRLAWWPNCNAVTASIQPQHLKRLLQVLA